jgi:large subunit ribosomal protein L13
MATKKMSGKAKAPVATKKTAKKAAMTKRIAKKKTTAKAAKATRQAAVAKVKKTKATAELVGSEEVVVDSSSNAPKNLNTIGTKYLTKEEALNLRKWWVIDATDKVVGRLASQIAAILRGKHKPQFTPNQDSGDFVIVTNTSKLVFTGNKLDDKRYYRHSRFFGSLKEKTAQMMMKEDPNFVLKQAVKNMLPKNRLSRNLLLKLKLFSGPEHTHQAQKPEALNLKY